MVEWSNETAAGQGGNSWTRKKVAEEGFFARSLSSCPHLFATFSPPSSTFVPSCFVSALIPAKRRSWRFVRRLTVVKIIAVTLNSRREKEFFLLENGNLDETIRLTTPSTFRLSRLRLVYFVSYLRDFARHEELRTAVVSFRSGRFTRGWVGLVSRLIVNKTPINRVWDNYGFLRFGRKGFN